ncbi:MAG TPA: hypothetical protein VJW20_07285 [Candidatus Angelobacter sp.]|nr:hypothetical protein [Candidatus Angelobacter sp.]
MSASQALFFKNHGNILNAVLTGTNLFIQDGERILQKLVPRLPEYNGDPEDDAAYVAWAVEAARPDIEKFRFFYELRKEYHGKVLGGIRSVLKTALDLSDYQNNLGQMADDLADIVWQWAFEHLEALMVPGVATLGTRLYASAKFRALTWRKKKLRELKRSSDIDVERLGIHNGELVLDENEDFYVDEPFYAEVDEDVEVPVVLAVAEQPDDDGDAEEQPEPAHAVALEEQESGTSGIPKAFCTECHVPQPVSPDFVINTKNLSLTCGHSRPRALASRP